MLATSMFLCLFKRASRSVGVSICSAGKYPTSLLKRGSYEHRNASLTNAAILDDSNKPPITIAVIQQNHSVSFSCICLALDRRNKGM